METAREAQLHEPSPSTPIPDSPEFTHTYVSVVFIYARNEYHSRGLHSELAESDCEMSTTAEAALRAQSIRIVNSRLIQTFVH